METQAGTQLINKSALVFTQPLLSVFENAMFTAELLKGPRRTRTWQKALLQLISRQLVRNSIYFFHSHFCGNPNHIKGVSDRQYMHNIKKSRVPVTSQHNLMLNYGV